MFYNPKTTTRTHTTCEVEVLEKGTSRAWKGNLTLLAASPCDNDDCSDTENMSCASSDCSSDLFYSDKEKGVFSFYQRGDGSAEDPDNIPQRYMDMARNDPTRALEAVEKTLEWRDQHGINDMLNKPHPKFDACKSVVPHFYVGRDVGGHVVYVQRPARLNAEQVKANGLTFDDLFHHSIYVQEYLWQIVESENPNATITSIIDAGDLSLYGMRTQKDQRELLLRMADTFDNHFPMRAHKTIIVNAPSWFSLLFKMVKPLLRESTTALIEVCAKGKNQDAVLLQHVGGETSKCLPDFCWSEPRSTTKTEVVQLEMEKELRGFVMSRIEASGETMAPVVA